MESPRSSAQASRLLERRSSGQTERHDAQDDARRDTQRDAQRDSQRDAQQRGSNLLHGKVTPTLWRFSLPLMLSFVVNIVYSWIDTYFISHLGAAAIAAIGFCEQLNFAIFTIASGLVTGTGILLARRIGEGKKEEAERIAAESVTAMIIFSLSIALSLFVALPMILPLFGLKADVLHFALEYMRTVLIGVPGIFCIFHLNVLMRSAGNSAFSMRTLLVSTGLNAVLAPLFVFGLGFIPTMGMSGAGLATALSQLCGAAWGFYEAFGGKAALTLPRTLTMPQWETLRSIVALGVPSSLQFVAVSAARVAMAGIANTFGTSVAAAYTLGLKVDFFVYMPIFAVGVALEAITGQNLGARQVRRVFQFYWASVIQVGLLTLLLAVVAFAFGSAFVRLFTTDEAIVAIAVGYLRILALGYPLFAVAVLSARVISGAGDTIRAMFIIGGMALFVQLPLVYGFAHFTALSYSGIWLGVLFTYALMAGVGLYELQGKKWLAAKI